MTKLSFSENGIADTKNQNFVTSLQHSINLHLTLKKWLIPYLRKATL